MDVEVRQPIEDAVTEDAATLRVRFRCGDLEFRSVVFQRDFRFSPFRVQSVSGGHRGGTSLHETTPGRATPAVERILHMSSPPLMRLIARFLSDVANAPC